MEVIQIYTNAEYQSQNNNNTSRVITAHDEASCRGDGRGDCEGWTDVAGSGWGESDSDGGHYRTGGAGIGSGTDGDSDDTGSGKGHGDGEGIEFGIQGAGYSSCISKEDGTGECCPTTDEDVSYILFEIGVPEHLHNLFLPLTPNNMLTTQDFIQAETQEQRDAVLGILELKHSL